jgi:hypothetical protein
MAQGDFTLFNEFSTQLLQGEHDLNATDTIKVALITNGTVPSASTTTPTFSDFTEVSGTNYTTGGKEVTSPVVAAVSGSTYKFDGDNVSWTQNAAGPTDVYYGILYNDTNGTDMAIGFIDMTTDGGTTPISLAAGNISINWNASGILTLG